MTRLIEPPPRSAALRTHFGRKSKRFMVTAFLKAPGQTRGESFEQKGRTLDPKEGQTGPPPKSQNRALKLAM